jgi:hypothetical protein
MYPGSIFGDLFAQQTGWIASERLDPGRSVASGRTPGVGDRCSDRVDLYYEDQGAGPPVVLIHGWP